MTIPSGVLIGGTKPVKRSGLSAVIIHLNNEHWTREQIADWLEGLERKAGLWDDVKSEPLQLELAGALT